MERHLLDPVEIMRIGHGRRTVEMIRLVARHLSAEDEARELAESKAAGLDDVQVILGAQELLNALPPRAWTNVVSGTLSVARARLTYAGLPFPPVLISADEVKRGKPQPDGHLAAAAKLGISPEQLVMIEDSPPVVDAAHAAGMRAVGVLSTHTPEEIVHADFQVRRRNEILLSSPGVADETSFRLELCDLRGSSPESGGRRRSAKRADQGAAWEERQ